MAGIDHSIYFQQQTPDIVGGFAQGYGQGANMRQMAEQREKEQATKQAFSKAMVRNPDGSVSFDSGMAMKNLAGINPEMAYQLHQNEVTQRAAKQKAEQERKAYEVDQMARALDGVSDEMSFQKTKSLLEARGLKTDVLGPKYDPVRIEGLKRAAIPYQDLLKNKLKREELDIRRSEAKGKKAKSNLPKPPNGYMWNPAGTEVVPIPGGPAAGKKEKAEDMKKTQASLVVQDLGRALNYLKDSEEKGYGMAAGPIAGTATSWIPGTPADTLEKLLESAKSNIGFDKLQAMRDASPTGGALGQVSEREIDLLQATAGKLSGDQPEHILEDNIKRMLNRYNDIVHGKGNGPKRLELSFDENGDPIVPDKKPVGPGLFNKPAEEMSDEELDEILGI